MCLPSLLSRRRVLAAALAAPWASRAQLRGQPRRVGFLAQITRPDPFDPHIFGSLAKALRELGYVEGQNLAMQWRFGGGEVARLPALARELADQQLEAVIAAGTLSAIAMHKATSTTPVVFGNVSDPVGAGVVQSLSRPGTNCTGIASLLQGMMPKLLELTREALPRADRVGLMINPLQPSHAGLLAGLQPMAQSRGIRLAQFGATTAAEIEQGFAAAARENMDAMLLPNEGLFIQHRRLIAQQGARYRLPLVSVDDELAPLGALLTYGADQHAMFRRLATYVDRVLRGGRPAEIPVEQPTQFLLSVNRRAEADLQLRVAPSLLIRADRVIE
jgi:putative ABC transport system substrate-binding protein